MKTVEERRRSQRRPVVEAFSFFVVVPKKGAHRLTVHDVSDEGLLFDLDLNGEGHASFPIQIGETIDAQLYVNQQVNIPLRLKVARIEKKQEVRRIGAEAVDKKGNHINALRSLTHFIDALTELAR